MQRVCGPGAGVQNEAQVEVPGCNTFLDTCSVRCISSVLNFAYFQPVMFFICTINITNLDKAKVPSDLIVCLEIIHENMHNASGRLPRQVGNDLLLVFGVGDNHREGCVNLLF